MRRITRHARQDQSRALFGRRISLLAVILAAQASISSAAPAPGAGTVIEHRFEVAHYVTRTLPAVPEGQKPTQSFYVIFDPTSPHGFWFLVFAFPTRSAASAARSHDLAQLEKIGTSGTYQVVQAGKIIYLGETGPINPGSTLIPTRFNAALAIAEARGPR
jgi:hypothetical protein